jgi:hypothetical protein
MFQVVLYDVEESQVTRALDNIRAELAEFEKEGILRGTLSAANQERSIVIIVHKYIVCTVPIESYFSLLFINQLGAVFF